MGDKQQQGQGKDGQKRAPANKADESTLTPGEALLARFVGTRSGAPADLPQDSNSRGLRQAQLVQLQRRHGNAFAQKMLAARTTGMMIARVGDEETDKPLLNPQALTVDQELNGHAVSVVQRQPDADIQRQGGGGTTANITLDVKPPTVNRAPEQSIAARHGSAGIAGWTKARLRASPTPPTRDHIDIKLTLSFTMDLAEEYSGEVLAVLQDHENGHVKISTDLVNKVKDDLKWYLESLPDFTADNEVAAAGAVKRAVQNFVTDDEEAQKAFDATDYQRMTQAYLGAKTPLADLEARSSAIAGMATALRGLIAAFDLGTLIQETAQGVIDAAGAVGGDDLHRLQYNREFKNLVATARYKINQMLEWENLLGEYLAGLLNETAAALGKFTWSA